MAKLTQFGRMRRRIKRELDAARAERALSLLKLASMEAAAMMRADMIMQSVVTAKMLSAWKRERSGQKLPDDLPGEPVFTAEPVKDGEGLEALRSAEKGAL